MKTVGVLLLLPVLFLSILAIQPDVRRRAEKYVARIAEGDFGIFGERPIAFASAALMSRDRPLFGVGPGRYPIEQVEVSSGLRVAAPETFGRSDNHWFDMVHNDFLEASAEGGIPLALGVVAFGIVFVGDGRRSPRDRLGALAISLLVAIAIEMMILFPLQVAAVYGTYALAGGLAQADATRS